jgi:valyl-tRNA synthetase
MARFIEMNRVENASELKLESSFAALEKIATHTTDKEWINKVKELTTEVTKHLDSFQFNLAAERLYDFTWHEFADKYIEDVKNRIDEDSFSILNSLFIIQLKLLHPFMPFVTEAIYQQIPGHGESIMIEPWPTA